MRSGMPTPLPDAERRRLVQGLLDRQVPPERIKELVNQAEGYGSPDSFSQGQDPFRSVSRGTPAMTSPPVEIPSEGAISPKTARQALASGAAILASPLTGAMSLIPAALAEGGIVGAADLGLQGLRKLGEPEYQIDPMESAQVGGGAALGSGIVRGVLGGLMGLAGNRAGIPKEAITEVAERAPMGGKKAYNMIKARPRGEEFALAKKAGAAANTARAPTLPAAKAALTAKPVQVDMQDVFDHIQSLRRSGAVNKAEDAANAALDDLAGRLPQSMKIEEFHNWIQRIRQPVKDAIGKEGGSLIAQDLKDIQNFARKHRDTLAGPESAAAFHATSEEIDAIKRFKNLLVDDKGNLRRSAPNTVARFKGNGVIEEVVRKYDEATGSNYAGLMDDLALNRQWSPKQTGDAGALTEMLAEAGRGRAKIGAETARKVAKGIAVVGPRGVPSQVGGAVGAREAAGRVEDKRIRAKDNGKRRIRAKP
jgi:hypothetical protein